MNRLSLAVRAAASALTGKDFTLNDPRTAALWGGGKNAPRLHVRDLLRMYATTPWLRAVSHKIGASTAAVPMKALAITRGKTKSAVHVPELAHADAFWRAKMISKERRRGNVKELEGHPIIELLARPNAQITGRVARLLMQVWADVAGNGYLWLEPNAAGMPVEAWPVPPTWVTPPTRTQPNFLVDVDGQRFEVAPEWMVWHRNPSVEDPYGAGVGIAQALANELYADDKASQRVGAFFANGAVPDLIVTLKNAGRENVRAAKQKFEAEHRGVLNAFRSFWTTNETSVTRLDTSFKDMQLIDLRRFHRDTVVQVFGVPPEALGIIENSNRATIDGADLAFAKGVLLPRLEFLRDELQARLVPLFDKRIVLDFENPVPEDREFKLKVMQADSTGYVHNEFRELSGHEPNDEFGEERVEDVGFTSFAAAAAEPAWSKRLLAAREPKALPAGDDADRRSLPEGGRRPATQKP